jgi:hypothetical protein
LIDRFNHGQKSGEVNPLLRQGTGLFGLAILSRLVRQAPLLKGAKMIVLGLFNRPIPAFAPALKVRFPLERG